jgi:hypothetical protein
MLWAVLGSELTVVVEHWFVRESLSSLCLSGERCRCRTSRSSDSRYSGGIRRRNAPSVFRVQQIFMTALDFDAVSTLDIDVGFAICLLSPHVFAVNTESIPTPSTVKWWTVSSL